MEVVTFEGEISQHFVGNLYAGGIVVLIKRGVDAHYAACAVQFGEKREDCDTLWGYHLEIPAELVTQALTDYTVQVALDKERGVYVIGAMKKE